MLAVQTQACIVTTQPIFKECKHASLPGLPIQAGSKELIGNISR